MSKWSSKHLLTSGRRSSGALASSCASCCLHLAKNVPLEKIILPNPDAAGGGGGGDRLRHPFPPPTNRPGFYSVVVLGFGFPGDSDG